jgi:hypothetical protein
MGFIFLAIYLFICYLVSQMVITVSKREWVLADKISHGGSKATDSQLTFAGYFHQQDSPLPIFKYHTRGSQSRGINESK